MGERTIGVCGFGRCGSTMIMRMLDVGGVPTIGDSGSYELEDNLASTIARQPLAGHAVKLLDLVLHEPLPPAQWKFIWLDRDVDQQARSTVKFMRGIAGFDPGPFALTALRKSFVADRPVALGMLQAIAGTDVFVASFEEILRQPRWHAEQLGQFLAPDFDFDWEAAAAAVHERTSECRPDLAFERSV